MKIPNNSNNNIIVLIIFPQLKHVTTESTIHISVLKKKKKNNEYELKKN
jgi:hypothetical protein